MPVGALRDALAAYPGVPVLVVDGTEHSPQEGEIVLVTRQKGRRWLLACVPNGTADAVAAGIGLERAVVVPPAGGRS